ncbi:hypothetical protein [Labilibaculum euxinus]
MNNFEKLSKKEMKFTAGGWRHVLKTDINNDGKWDIKFVYNSRTGIIKVKQR